MSISALRAHELYKEIAINRKLYIVRDDGGYIAPIVSNGKRSMSFWSSESKAQKIVTNVEAYKAFKVVEISFE